MANFREFLEKNTIFYQHPVPNARVSIRFIGDRKKLLFGTKEDWEGKGEGGMRPKGKEGQGERGK